MAKTIGVSRVAVLADIHGNLPALEAVLADVEREGADRIVLNGDIADGPFPAETLDRLLALGDRALWLRGNSDRWLVEAFDGSFPYAGAETDDMLRWAAGRLTRRHRDRLAALPLTLALDVPGLGRIGFCHATARSDNEMILVDSPLAHYRDAFATIEGGTILVGHCHMPSDRLAGGRRVVNSGSVGMPYGHRGASWAMIDGDVVLRRTAVDGGAAAAQIDASSMPGAAAFVRTYIVATPGDEEALDAFHAVARRQRAGGTWD